MERPADAQKFDGNLWKVQRMHGKLMEHPVDAWKVAGSQRKFSRKHKSSWKLTVISANARKLTEVPADVRKLSVLD